ncbi:TetR/AcrR family transcriptional regulator [Mycobacterium yunnanensis]|uniref:TetR/AcrR family transcriptional regulator n=1 Tax=Mycobacterium yunnanensis TaxID=368477 RepID=A0A9X3BVZ3_9MYCO|nr:TetR/AcrR family transcriptional regulator [Mycobacterium yunnanensis]MCV7423800.1 TetR/AcrR family transcriptional regulator [Mycobacterium yunnanensis]
MTRAASPKASAEVGRRQDRRRKETEGRLLAAGLEELHDSADGDISIRAVADRAGVSPANAYKYFSSKNALVAAIYLGLLQDLPLRTDVNVPTALRVVATMEDMLLVAAHKPELATACAASLIVSEPVVEPIRKAIAEEVSRRITSALGPGWPAHMTTSLGLIFNGALIGARFESFEKVWQGLEDAVHAILGEPPH